jgi:type IV secretory pathway VirB4 component
MPSDLGNSQELVSIDRIAKNTIVLKNGALRQILMVSGVNVALKSEQEQNILTLAYQNFLNSVDFPLQIVVHSRKVNIEKYLANLEQLRLKETTALLQSQNSEYQNFIKSFIQENAIMEKTFYVVVSLSPSGIPSASSVSKLNIFHKQSGVEESQALAETKARFEENLAQLNQRTTQVAEGLRAMDLQAKVLTDEQLVELFYNLYNPESVEKEDIELPSQK